MKPISMGRQNSVAPVPLVAWLLTGGGFVAGLLDGCSGGDSEVSQYW